MPELIFKLFQLLVRPLKMFIKTACCFPERITTKDYDSVLVELQDSEKVSAQWTENNINIIYSE